MIGLKDFDVDIVISCDAVNEKDIRITTEECGPIDCT
jgi:hypothetical protein